MADPVATLTVYDPDLNLDDLETMLLMVIAEYRKGEHREPCVFLLRPVA